MKHYFLTAKHVGDLTAILCADLEERQAKPAPVLSRVIARLRPRAQPAHARARPTTSSSRTTASIWRAPNVFKRDPVNLIRLFYLAQKHNLAIHPEAMRTATRSLKLIDVERARRPGSQPAVPGNPDLEKRSRDRAAAHERSRRARRIRPRLRPHRGDDAVQHVPPLYGGRASAALHRHPQRDRARRQPRSGAGQRADAHHPAGASQACSMSRCSCTTSPRAASRIIRSPARASPAGCVRGSASMPPRPSSSPGWSKCIS